MITDLLKDLTPGAVGIWTIVAMIVGAFFRFRPLIVKAEAERDGSLRADLLKRISDLEKEMAAERRECAKELDKMREQLSAITRQFLQYQMAVAQAIPPSRRSAEISKALDSLNEIVEADSDTSEGQKE